MIFRRSATALLCVLGIVAFPIHLAESSAPTAVRSSHQAVVLVAAAAPAQQALLGPGQVKEPGESCYSNIQPPDGQACPQRQDTDCRGTNHQIGECMAARWGWFNGPRTGDEWACLDHRITDIENHDWSTTLYNTGGSRAYGIPQALPGSKMGGPNHVEVVGGGYRGNYLTDPYIQIAWLRVYVVDDYGSPCGVPRSGSY